MMLVTVFVSPDLYEQLIMCHDPAGVLHEVVKQAIFGRTQFDQFPFQPYFAAVEINFEAVIYFNDLVHRAASSLGTTDDSFHAADHFTWAERFGNVVVRAQL